VFTVTGVNHTPSPTPNPAQRLAQRRRHVRSIRRRVAGFAAGTFLAATSGILVQLVTGHDPALAHGGSSGSKASAAATSTTSSATRAAVAGQSTRTAVASAPSPITTSAS
jgi:hypothetical protein